MRALVVYGTKRAGTFGIAEWIGDTLTEAGIQTDPVMQVQQAIDRVGARGHVTFGGRLLSDARGFPAGAMAKKKAGDWRDPARVRSWATAVAAELQGAQTG
jgi:hypothetical protein